jgi:hypothetical protein
MILGACRHGRPQPKHQSIAAGPHTGPQNLSLSATDPITHWIAANLGVAQDPAGNLKPARDKSTERIDVVATDPIACPPIAVWA